MAVSPSGAKRSVQDFSNNKLESRHGFAYYEPLTPRERPKQESAAFSPTTSNLITEAVTTQGTQQVSPNQGEAATPLSSVPSTQPATTAAPGKCFAKSRVRIYP